MDGMTSSVNSVPMVMPATMMMPMELRAKHRERHGAEDDDERIAEAVELRGQHEDDQNNREHERGQKFISFLAQKPRVAGVIQLVAAGQNPRAFAFQKFQRLFQRHD